MTDTGRYLIEKIGVTEKALGVDRRFSYTNVTELRKGEIEVEISREEIFRNLPNTLEDFSSDPDGREGIHTLRSPSGEKVRLRLLQPMRDRILWVVSSVGDVRKEPAHTAELVTQAIMGDVALMLKREGDWYLVCLRDDYLGWIRSWYVHETNRGEVESYNSRANVIVETNVSYVLTEPRVGSLPVSDMVAGTYLVASDSTGDFRRVALPGGKEGYMRVDDVRERAEEEGTRRERIALRAKRFLGIPYLWGGTSTKGFDCSGLVQRIFFIEGVELPRDTDRQALIGKGISHDHINEARGGDLLFFGEGGTVNHVAIYIGNQSFIHAHGEVRINSLREDDPLYDGRFAKSLLFARSVLP